MTFHMVIYRGSPAGDLRITAELWVNEAFVPAVSCHDVFEQSGIVFMRAHMLTHSTHSPVLHTHTHRTHSRRRQRQKDSSVIESHWGWQFKGSCVLSLSQSPSFFLSHPLISLSLFFRPRFIHSSISLLSSWSSLCCLTFRILSSCLRLAGRGVGPAVTRRTRWSGLAWAWWLELGKTYWPYWRLWQQTQALRDQLQLSPVGTNDN